MESIRWPQQDHFALRPQKRGGLLGTGTTRSERCPTFAAQLHLPTHDLFWANLKVQLHLPPLRSLDLLVSPGTLRPRYFLYCCLTSTEARCPISDGDRVGRGQQSEGSIAETARKRPKRPWTAARTMEVLRRCPLAIAQRLVHCAIAVSTTVLGQSHKDNARCTAVDEQLGQPEAKEVQLAQPSSTSLLMISSGQI